MAVPTKMSDLATAAASNSPAGTDAIGNSLDDYLRAHAFIIRSTNALASASIAAAATVDIGAADGESVEITGAATITSLGTVAAGLVRELRFSSAGAVLTDSSAIVLPSGNLTVAAGDVFVFRSLGSGNWVLVAANRLTINATAAGLALLDDADATAQRATLGLGTVATQGANALIVSETAQSVTAVASTTIDLAAGQSIQLAQAVDITTLSFSNAPAGAFVVTIRRTKDASGMARTIAWPASVNWAGGTAPTLTSTASAVDIISLLSIDGGVTYDGVYSLDSK